MQTTLLIMAAGIGSRFGGGIKQLEPVDEQGHIIMDYSIHDAIEAGFNKVVFIIRKDIENEFKDVIGNRIEAVCKAHSVTVEYVFQDINDIPGELPKDRTKPWGTGQAILAAKDNRVFLKQEDIKKAFVKVGIGAEKKSRVISEKEKRITAFHEAGHAILFHVLPDVGPVYSVSIIPTGSAGGYTMPLPEKDEMFNTKGKMLQDITVALGGRVAEEEVFDDITTGASQDIKQATGLAKSMVTKFGMSEAVGLINYDDDNNEVFIGRDLAHTARGYGEGVATVIDQEVKRIIDECYDRARHIIRKYDDVLHACADLLLEKEKISREEFEALFPEDVSED